MPVCRKLQSTNTINGILRGTCNRMLFDKKILSAEEVATRMRYALSRSVAPHSAAEWLEGFLQGSGLLLLHNQALWNLLDEWVSELSEESFSEILAMLRRTFAEFSPPERQRMMALARQDKSDKPRGADIVFHAERANMVEPTVRLLLGTVK